MALVRVAALLAALAVALPAAVTAGPVRARADLQAALAYLDATVVDGGTLAPAFVEAVAAAGNDAGAWPANRSALARMGPVDASGNLLAWLRPAHALAVAGRLDPDSATVHAILAQFHDGQFGDPALLNDDMWALMTLLQAGVPAGNPSVQSSAGYLLAHQASNGGWGWAAGSGAESDETGMAVVALAQTGRLDSNASRAALSFLARQTGPDGGVALAAPSQENCDSTVWSIRAHEAAGAPVPTLEWRFLEALRLADGSFAFAHGAPAQALCTAELATLLGDGLAGGWDLSGYGVDPKPAPSLSPITLLACAAGACGRARGRRPSSGS